MAAWVSPKSAERRRRERAALIDPRAQHTWLRYPTIQRVADLRPHEGDRELRVLLSVDVRGQDLVSARFRIGMVDSLFIGIDFQDPQGPVGRAVQFRGPRRGGRLDPRPGLLPVGCRASLEEPRPCLSSIFTFTPSTAFVAARSACRVWWRR